MFVVHLQCCLDVMALGPSRVETQGDLVEFDLIVDERVRTLEQILMVDSTGRRNTLSLMLGW